VRELTPDKDKHARAIPLTVELEGARLLLPRQATWLEPVVAELLAFPSAAHDDVVDALAYGVAVTSISMPGADRWAEPLRDDPDFEPTEMEKVLADFMPNPPDGYHESWRHRQVRLWKSRRGGW